MVKIKIFKDTYIISNERCYMLAKTKILKGKTVISPFKYYEKLENCLYDALDIKVKLSDITSLTELFNAYREGIKEIKEAIECQK